MHDATQTDDEALIGEAAHIVAQSGAGPRGDPSFPEDRRDKYSNLILLCRNHHRTVDQQAEHYSIDVLNEMKEEHEAWVRASLGDFDEEEQRDKERYAGIVGEWIKRVYLSEWENWTANVLEPQPQLHREWLESLEYVGPWLLGRIWPGRYPSLEQSFLTFRLVLQDFLRVFRKHQEPRGDDWIGVRAFYRISEWDPERYHRLGEEYEHHVDLIHDLTFELTRAANLVCDQVRKHVDESFRLSEGTALVTRGSMLDMVTYRPEYGDGLGEQPYRGLERFRDQDRFKRDIAIGNPPNGGENL